ncbi:MAG TPA: signal peptidase I [Kiloniellales bacterium]
MENRKVSALWETLRTVFYAVVIALVVRTFAFEPFNIPSGSMKPTLLEGDYLFVSKYSYGYSRYSLPWGLPLFEGRIFGSAPERGDVIVFKKPSDNETDYIKRLIGLPGDRIQVTGGILHINGEPVRRERIGETADRDTFSTRTYQVYRESLPNGRQHLIWEASDNDSLDNTSEYLIPEGHYFFMGDNRDNSRDSRVLYDVGYVPAENLVGRAEFLFFSHDDSASWWEVWRWPWMIRFGRIFSGIH